MQMDPRQKKMTIWLVFYRWSLRLFWSFRWVGLGRKEAKTNAASDAREPTETARITDDYEQWQLPEPLPAQLRNPMAPQVANRPARTDNRWSGQMVVRGYCFQQRQPFGDY